MSRVLIIEDDPVTSLFAETCLSAAGYEVLTAEDGETGLRLAVEQHPDVVVTDVMMPGIHGLGVVEAIRSNPQLSAMRLVVCSMKAYASDIQQAKNAGADRFLAKPYTPEALQQVVADLVSGAPASFGPGSGSAPQSAATPTKTGAFTRDQLMGLTTTSSTAAGARLRVKFWGTRGSIATPGPHTVRYGGNTACTEVRFGEHILVLDAGTGLRELGNSLMSEFGTQPIRAHLLVGHTHWDHIQGFPFFAPAYVKGNKFFIYSMRAAGKPLERIFRGQMDVDYFPVVLSDMQATLRFVELHKAVQIGPLTIRFHYLNHPGIAVGFRIEAGSQSVVYTSDHEPFHRTQPGAAGEAEERKVTEFAAGADLWIREAQYSEAEYALKKGWGHSTFDDAMLSAAEAQVRHLSIFHHDPMHDDAFLDGVVEKLRSRAQQAGYGFTVDAAREGQVIEL
jgi:phosphoribosyl 1,2-cyclic phosphodiesterase/CheY-like chemotaxis protein